MTTESIKQIPPNLPVTDVLEGSSTTSGRRVLPCQVSVLARELHAVLDAAAILEGEPVAQPLIWAAERLSETLEIMTEALERKVSYSEVFVGRGGG